MSRPVTHITFAAGMAINPDFARAVSAVQRRDPGVKSGYWLVNISEPKAKAIAQECGQPFERMMADSRYPLV